MQNRINKYMFLKAFRFSEGFFILFPVIYLAVCMKITLMNRIEQKIGE